MAKWFESDIDIVEIDGELYALNGWNGEKYTDCWKCVDRWTADPDGKTYEVIPHYDWEEFDEDVEPLHDEIITGYEVL